MAMTTRHLSTSSPRSQKKENDPPSSSANALTIHCGESTAQLHEARFGPGGRSVCVLHEGRWMSLSQFETVAGRQSCHNWKRSIRHQGRSLQHWITAGKLKPCDKYCQCTLCRVPVTRQSLNSDKTNSTTTTTPVNLTLAKLKGDGDDSDSGISVDSFSKALKVDVGVSPASEASSTSPAPPTASTSKASTSSSAPKKKTTEPATLPDYTTLVQEALLSLRGASASEKGKKKCDGDAATSQINILLYVLHKYAPKEDVTAVNAKVRSALLFLSRMDLVEKTTVDGVRLEPGDDSEREEEEEADSEEEMDAEEEVKKNSEAKAEVKQPSKKKKKLDEKKKNKKTEQANKAKKIVKKAKDTAAASSNTGQVKATAAAMSAPKRLSPQLSAVCGGSKKLCRQDVVKGVWAYIKGNDLQDPAQRTTIICDDKLRAVTKKKRILQTDMLRCLAGHMTELDGSKLKKKKKVVAVKKKVQAVKK